MANKFLALSLMVVATAFASCCTDDNPVTPTQQEIETKIVGKWKSTYANGIEFPTNDRSIETYEAGGKGYESNSKVHPISGDRGWINKKPFTYTVSGNYLTVMDNHPAGAPEGAPEGGSMPEPNPVDNKEQILSIDDNSFTASRLEGTLLITMEKVTVDYSKDIIGMWEGVEMTGNETHGNADHRIKYKEDGTYEYYVKSGDAWVLSTNVGNEYSVDGDWLATRWRDDADAEYNYEWWDIDYIRGDEMKWSALREDVNTGERFGTTFTWKRVH